MHCPADLLWTPAFRVLTLHPMSCEPPYFITIVAGLPRSGTSLMMQILAAGGMTLLTDRLRKADEDNPKGYLEFEPVKQTKTSPAWVADARGKAVKMVHL